MERMTSSALRDVPDLPDWRVLLQAAEAVFAAPSFGDAVEFVSVVAGVCAKLSHLPDVHIRPDGTVRIRLVSFESKGLTDADVVAARQISALAAERGIPGVPSTLKRFEIAIDALDIQAVLPFWRAVLGYIDETPVRTGEPVSALIDPAGIGPAVWFQQMDTPRPERNRIHLDVTVPHDAANSYIAAAVAAGGRLLSDAGARAFWVLADAEGNEACVCTWQDRD
jgi:4a-hydroxytetrahydrobiopterin dehydratase